MKRAEKRAHLLDVATGLFNRLGYRGVGIDQVIAESGVAKTTLYRHFPSKDDLIVAVLDRVDEQFRNDMRAYVEQRASDPGAQLIASFDFLEDWFHGKDFYGCPFVNAASEYSDRKSGVFRAAMVHKRMMVTYFQELARAAGLAQPANLAQEINLLHEGAIAVAHITGDSDSAVTAKQIAARIIRDASADRDAV